MIDPERDTHAESDANIELNRPPALSGALLQLLGKLRCFVARIAVELFP